MVKPIKVSIAEQLVTEVNRQRPSGPIRELAVFSHGWQGGLNLGGADGQHWQLRNFMISDVPRIARSAFIAHASVSFLGCNTASTDAHAGDILESYFGTRKTLAQVFAEHTGAEVHAFACSSHFEAVGKDLYQVPDKPKGRVVIRPKMKSWR